MGYVVVVFAIINTAALVAAGWFLRDFIRDGPGFVERAIAEEIRKQDDRIEKRLERRERQPEDAPETLRDGAMRVGVPYRR